MGWLAESVMEQKLRFIQLWLTDEYTVSGLCESFGISRTTGYKLIDRYYELGEEAFKEGSRAPLSIPHRTPIRIEKKIVALRNKHETWGARKIKVLLEKDFRKEQIPSETTINAIFKRNGLVKNRRRRTSSLGKQYPKFDPKYCNEIWSADYKGKFKLGNGRYCCPLTICDSKSRKIMGIKCHYKMTYKAVKQAYKEVFREHGLPYFMHTDNGSPFGSVTSLGRYTRLSYWLIEKGVIPVFSDPASPQQNGRHERMHRDLKAYCRTRMGSTLAKQQVIMDSFVEEYNNIRPHEAIKMKTPQSVHIPSERIYPEKKTEYEYPFNHKKIKVTVSGAARWGAYHWLLIGRGAIGRYVAAEQIDDHIWNVYYRNVLLGYFDERKFMKKQGYQKLIPPEV